jgi:hypothetical protein
LQPAASGLHHARDGPGTDVSGFVEFSDELLGGNESPRILEQLAHPSLGDAIQPEEDGGIVPIVIRDEEQIGLRLQHHVAAHHVAPDDQRLAILLETCH